MADAVGTLLPLLLFMLIPLWIPIFASLVGLVIDKVSGDGRTVDVAARKRAAAEPVPATA